MLGKWPSPAKLPETHALKVSALDQESFGWTVDYLEERLARLQAVWAPPSSSP